MDLLVSFITHLSFGIVELVEFLFISEIAIFYIW